MSSTETPTRTLATGIQFPADEKGARSTGSLARTVVADALAEVDPRAADGIRTIRDWRKNYLAPFNELVRAGVHDSRAWTGIARAALTSIRSGMVAVHEGSEIPVDGFLDAARPRFRFDTETLEGDGPRKEELTIPYRGRELSGRELREQLEDWVARGIIEPSCADAVREVQAHPEWLSLPGRSVLVLGLGSEMGPASTLLSWGATVVGVDLPSSRVWQRLRDEVPETAGTLLVPRLDGELGADLLEQLPELSVWAEHVSDTPLTVGTYAYADGGAHVRLSTAADALATRLLDRGSADALAFLATPMDTFVVPPDVREQSNAAYEDRQRGFDIRTLAGRVTGHKLFHRNYDIGDGPGVHDALVPQQGPNYTLAKRVQRWRATAAHGDGHTVSITVAPSTNTRSVTKNKALAFAYRGASVFGIEILEPETSSALLASLLVHDLNATTPRPEVQWMEESRAAASGGLWRQPYQPRTALTVAAAIGTVKR